jgi:glycosyltransferase involved in cell wall biosynthesis
MKLSIIVCVLNEIKTIKKLLEKIDQVSLPGNIAKEIIVVDNYSTDGTREFLKTLQKKNYLIYFQEKNLGKGNSIIKGISLVSGDIIVLQDADLEYDPNNYKKLIDHLIKHDLDGVFGSRILSKNDNFIYKLNKFAVIILSKLINLLFKSSYTDTATNHKLIKTTVVKKLNLISKGFDLDFEIACKLAKYNYKVDEIPIKYYPRSYEDGKKINFIDAFKGFFVIIYCYFN